MLSPHVQSAVKARYSAVASKWGEDFWTKIPEGFKPDTEWRECSEGFWYRMERLSSVASLQDAINDFSEIVDAKRAQSHLMNADVEAVFERVRVKREVALANKASEKGIKP